MKKIKGFALLILATGLIIPLTIIYRWYVDAKYGDTNGYWKVTARNIDVWANAEFRALWNSELRTQDGTHSEKQAKQFQKHCKGTANLARSPKEDNNFIK